MEHWLEWARGPAFRFAMVLMVLGVLRLLALQVWALYGMIRRAGNKQVPWGAVLGETARWLLAFRRRRTERVLFTLISVLFHISIIVVPVFLGAHILLWERGLGISWPALGQTAADALTLLAVGSALLLFGARALSRAGRALSRPQDYFFPLLIAAIFLSGFLAMHPSLNPFTHTGALLVHVLTGNLALLLLPFSKLSHAVLFPFTQLTSELGWHLVPEAHRNVARELGKEGEAI